MKKIHKTLLIFGVLMSLSAAAFAEGLENKNAIGMYILGGEESVGGLQYERRFSDLLSVKFGTFAFYQENSYSANPLNIQFTVEPDFCLYEANWNKKVSSRLFAYGMVGYDLSKIESYDYETDKYKDPKMVHTLLAAAGFGFDFIFFGHLSLPLQFGFSGRFNNDNPNVGFCGGIALRYAW